MSTLSKLRRMVHRDHLSVREASRRLGISRNTAAKWLEADEMVEPRYPKRASLPSVLDPYKEQLATWLKADSHRNKRERRGIKAMFRALQAMGYPGSRGPVYEFAKRWQQAQSDAPTRMAFVPMSFEMGEAFQFDWSCEYLFVGGMRKRLEASHTKLAASRAFMLTAYFSQAHEMLFDAHARAFAAFGGVPRRGIYDNMKTAVDRIGKGRERQVNLRFQVMVNHYVFDAEFCNAAAGWEKGQIEKNVQDSRHRLWHGAPAFDTLADLNDWLAARCIALWSELAHPEQKDRTIADVWAEERPTLMAAPTPFDGFVEHTKRVSPTCLVHFERNRYSVPATFANRPISLRVYAHRLVMATEGHTIAEHVRCFDRRHAGGQTLYDWRHYLAVLQRKPGALRNGAPFLELPDGFKRLQAQLTKRPGGDREMVEILALVLHHDEEAVLSAVELALESGVPSKLHVLNLLGRLVEQLPPAPVTTPQDLVLGVEPQANVIRYDSLREKRHAA